MWPFRKPERRESLPFTDAVVAALGAQASGQGVTSAGQTAALEAATALYVGAFVGARIEPPVPALRPAVIALIVRDLIRRGESLHEILVDRGELRLQPVGSWDVRGGWDERTWFYRVDEFGPSGNITRFRPAAAIVHCRYAVDPARPWLGIGPLGWARLAGTMLANSEARLGEEASGGVSRVVPLPSSMTGAGNQDKLAALKADFAKGRGRAFFPPDHGGRRRRGARCSTAARLETGEDWARTRRTPNLAAHGRGRSCALGVWRTALAGDFIGRRDGTTGELETLHYGRGSAAGKAYRVGVRREAWD